MRQVGKVKKTLLASQCEGGKCEVHQSLAVEAEEVALAFSGEVPRSTHEEVPRKFAPDGCRERLFMSRAWEWEGSRRDTGGSGAFRRRSQVSFGFPDRTSCCACAVGLYFSRAWAAFSRAWVSW